jgi:hypothetical protein
MNTRTLASVILGLALATWAGFCFLGKLEPTDLYLIIGGAITIALVGASVLMSRVGE